MSKIREWLNKLDECLKLHIMQLYIMKIIFLKTVTGNIFYIKCRVKKLWEMYVLFVYNCVNTLLIGH